MDSSTIRTKFIEYFKSKKHSDVPSSSVIPIDDPTILFTNAGMNQFKDVFLGKSKRDYSRAVTSQKCVRVGGKHNDLDNVGHTTRHMTFFEMLGNFSFGDYFKKEAIDFAYEFAITILEIPLDKVWVSVYEKDEEAYTLWQKYFPKERIVKIGDKDNFWSMGEVGPCGPCTELFYDRGDEFGSATSPKDDEEGERFFEFWNLVFMQYNRDSTGLLKDLPKPCVDTGMGLERLAAIKQNVHSVFETDILRKIIGFLETASNVKYDPKDEKLAPAFHVVSDHIRTLCFAIADGAMPSNVDRGYVLRKLLRRSVRYGRLLGFDKPFLHQPAKILIDLMGEDYPELVKSEKRIYDILKVEEESFLKTLARGGNMLNNIIDTAKKSKKKELSGQDAFKLKDTYGFPLEEILLIAKDSGLQVNLEQFELLEHDAKELSRGARNVQSEEVKDTIFEDFVKSHGETKFNGYTTLHERSTIIGLFRNGVLVESMDEGDKGIVVLDITPFYAEMGGQVGDHGLLQHDKAKFSVDDTTSPFKGVTAHHGTLTHGTLILGEPIDAEVDQTRRQNVEVHHTATHLLHKALEKVLGEHVKQSGSLVQADRLRFDYSHHKTLSISELQEVEHLVNEQVMKNCSVHSEEIAFDKVQNDESIKQFFGDKYGKMVRVVDVEGFSKELCGGTHLKSTASIGLFRILRDGAISSGIRRIEAVCGIKALDLMYERENMLNMACTKLKTDLTKFETSFDHFLEESKQAKTKLKGLEKKELKGLAAQSKPEKVGDIDVFAIAFDLDGSHLVEFGNHLMGKGSNTAICLIAKSGDRVSLLIRLSKDLVDKGFNAGALINEVAPTVGGKGGGRKDMAQAGGSNAEKIPEALTQFKSLLARA